MDLRRPVEAHLESTQVVRVVYGAIIGLAVVVGLQAHPPPTGAVLATILGTALAVALAEIYSEVIGMETRTRRPVDRRALRHALGEGGFVAFGVAFPAVFFLLVALGVMEQVTAFTVAKWSGLGLVGFYGLCAARLAGAGWWHSILRAAAVALIGAVLIALKALVH
jgi:hypothetical protein